MPHSTREPKETPDAADQTGSDRVMHSFRMRRNLVDFLKAEARRGQRDLTAHVVRLLEGVRSYFGLPEAASSLLEADRRALGMERYEYLLHVLYQRGVELRQKGPGFDAPGLLDREGR